MAEYQRSRTQPVAALPELKVEPNFVVGKSVDNIFGDAVILDEVKLNSVQVVDSKSMHHWTLDPGQVMADETNLRENSTFDQTKADVIAVPNLGKDYQDDLNKVTELRLKSVGSLPFTKEDRDRLNLYNSFISYANIQHDAEARQQQDKEAQVLKIAEEVEALLASTTNETEIESVYARLETIVQKLGTLASAKVLGKMAELKKAIADKASKSEAK